MYSKIDVIQVLFLYSVILGLGRNTRVKETFCEHRNGIFLPVSGSLSSEDRSRSCVVPFFRVSCLLNGHQAVLYTQ